MQWRDARDERTAWSDDSLFDAIEASIDEGWRIDGSIGARVLFAPVEVKADNLMVHWKQPVALLATSERLMIARKRKFKSPDVRWWTTGSFPRYGKRQYGTQWVVDALNDTDGPVSFHFLTPREMDAFENWLLNGHKNAGA